MNQTGAGAGAMFCITLGAISAVIAYACLSGRNRRWIYNPIMSWSVIGAFPAGIGLILIGAAILLNSAIVLWMGMISGLIGVALGLWSPSFLYPRWARDKLGPKKR